MRVRKLDHVNIRTERLDETIAFYTGVLGMIAKPPPGREDTTKSAWIYDEGDLPVIHLGTSESRYPTDGVLPALNGAGEGSGTIHHVALECLGYQATVDRLKGANLQIATNELASMELRQVFVQDPNGVILELNFRGAEAV
jgi:catechol 2,3-dioxygenase-like lactoylglutathione lyase family enzyme